MAFLIMREGSGGKMKIRKAGSTYRAQRDMICSKQSLHSTALREREGFELAKPSLHGVPKWRSAVMKVGCLHCDDIRLTRTFCSARAFEMQVRIPNPSLLQHYYRAVISSRPAMRCLPRTA